MNFLAAGLENGFSSSGLGTSLAAPIHSTWGWDFSSISFLYYIFLFLMSSSICWCFLSFSFFSFSIFSYLSFNSYSYLFWAPADCWLGVFLRAGFSRPLPDLSLLSDFIGLLKFSGLPKTTCFLCKIVWENSSLNVSCSKNFLIRTDKKGYLKI